MKILTIEEAKEAWDRVEIIVCDCGFHLGLDVNYMQSSQGSDIKINCPACNTLIDTETLYEPADYHKPANHD